MEIKERKNQLSILTDFIEVLPENITGIESQLNWTPVVEVNIATLHAVSPTTEYSSTEGKE